MLEFQTLEELIQRCVNCAYCKQTKKIAINLDSDDRYDLISFDYQNNILTLNVIYNDYFFPEEDIPLGKHRSCVKYNISFIISTVNNTYKTIITDTLLEAERYLSIDLWLSFYIVGNCDHCGSSTISNCLDFDALNKNINQFSIDYEIIKLYKNNYIDCIQYEFNKDLMFIQKTSNNKNLIKLPLYMLDFSDKDKIISKIKTYITFS